MKPLLLATLFALSACADYPGMPPADDGDSALGWSYAPPAAARAWPDPSPPMLLRNDPTPYLGPMVSGRDPTPPQVYDLMGLASGQRLPSIR